MNGIVHNHSWLDTIVNYPEIQRFLYHGYSEVDLQCKPASPSKTTFGLNTAYRDCANTTLDSSENRIIALVSYS